MLNPCLTPDPSAPPRSTAIHIIQSSPIGSQLSALNIDFGFTRYRQGLGCGESLDAIPGPIRYSARSADIGSTFDARIAPSPSQLPPPNSQLRAPNAWLVRCQVRSRTRMPQQTAA